MQRLALALLFCGLALVACNPFVETLVSWAAIAAAQRSLAEIQQAFAPSPTDVPQTPTPIITPLLAAQATPTAEPTLVDQTRTPTGVPLLPGKATPSTITMTPTRSATPTPGKVTFRFDEGVSETERDTIKSSTALAQSYLGGVGDLTVVAFANLDALAEDEDKTINGRVTSKGTKALVELFSTDGFSAISEESGIWIWINEDWKYSPKAQQQMSVVHEYFHNIQRVLAKKDPALAGPIWLREGAAEVVAYAVLAQAGIYNLDEVHADKVTRSRGMHSPLSTVNTLSDSKSVDIDYPYSIGYLAVEYLITQTGGERIETLKKFWQAQPQVTRWQDAFEKTFGVSLLKFYSMFDDYREKEFPAFCGPVRSPYPWETPAPLSLKFVRRLAPGEMFRFGSIQSVSWSTPYIFCATGMRPSTLPASAFKLPPGADGLSSCGAGCLTLYMQRYAPKGNYTLAIVLPDGWRAEATFEHKP
jgi:hypothetical protein